MHVVLLEQNYCCLH